MSRRMVAASFFLAVALGPATHIGACSCSDYPRAKEAWRDSGLVFTGKVIDVRAVSLPKVIYSQDERKKELVPAEVTVERGVFTLEVTHAWKGEMKSTIQVLAGLPQGESGLVDCDAHLEIGKEYLIFATEGYPDVDVCTPWGLAVDRLEQMAELDKADRKHARPVKTSQ